MRYRRIRSSKQAVLVALLCVVSVLAVGMQLAPAEAQDVPGFHVRNGRLFDGYGNDFVMRGANHAHTWFAEELDSLAAIKATGANTVRIALSSGAWFERTEADEVAQIVSECRRTQLVCVLSVQDTTGFPDASEAIPLDAAVDYWIEMADLLRGHESFVLITLGNEPIGSSQVDQWLPATISGIERLRQAGFDHTLVVNAPDWGQDLTFTMRDNAAQVLEADSHGNVLFDIHMFGLFDETAKVRSYIESFVRAELPLIIGEFGPNHPSGDTDELAILQWAHLYGIGYLGWSWSGNVAPVADLNLVNDFSPEQRTPWGDLLIGHVHGIAETAIEASIFGEPRVLPRPMLATLPELPAQVLPQASSATGPAVLVTQVEAEHGARNGLQVSLRGAGFSGNGYLTGFDSFGDSMTVLVEVDHDGLYELGFGYRSPFGDKTQQLAVNGESVGAVVFPEASVFQTMRHGEVELVAGSNRITITSDWGWFDLDSVQVFSVAG